jgi:hypothetical protein
VPVLGQHDRGGPAEVGEVEEAEARVGRVGQVGRTGEVEVLEVRAGLEDRPRQAAAADQVLADGLADVVRHGGRVGRGDRVVDHAPDAGGGERRQRGGDVRRLVGVQVGRDDVRRVAAGHGPGEVRPVGPPDRPGVDAPVGEGAADRAAGLAVTAEDCDAPHRHGAQIRSTSANAAPSARAA